MFKKYKSRLMVTDTFTMEYGYFHHRILNINMLVIHTKDGDCSVCPFEHCMGIPCTDTRETNFLERYKEGVKLFVFP